ncbi:type II secretion system F family protein [Petrocella sp. FN5]|uniref:type II secretion system F family protein n=1 Tax=Petrocella sp. FN5 TaxID=3032002 RepID=UPI0023DCD25F|nr:type II secretion system F family protein [Petrocella sp. FN5]MDF1617096.1 type II secretion system F family protein [Petrocella sp. FN5]
MYEVIIIFFLGIHVLYFVYAKRTLQEGEDRTDFLYILGAPILRRLSFDKVKRLLTDQELEKLSKIYRPKDYEQGVCRYQGNRIGLIMLVLFLGGLFALAIGQDHETSREMDPIIERPPYDQDPVVYDLNYFIEDEESLAGRLPVRVEPKLPNRDMAVELLSINFSKLEPLMLKGMNPNDVHEDLFLPKKPFGEEVTVRYTSLTTDYLSHEGVLKRDVMVHSTPYEVSLLVNLGLGEVSMAYVYDFRIRLKETSAKEFAETIEDHVVRTEDRIILPVTTGESQIPVLWSTQEVGISGFKIFLVAVLMAIVFYILKKGELDQTLISRKEEILYDFPTVVNKLTMLINAGMTFSSAWQKIVADHQQNKMSKGILYEEMMLVSQDIKNGISEIEALECFGKRTQCKEIIRFVAVITQNLKRGSQSMTIALKQLSREAWTIRTTTARRLGEKASTKLLLPMGISLITVLIIVMVPTFMAMKI